MTALWITAAALAVAYAGFYAIAAAVALLRDAASILKFTGELGPITDVPGRESAAPTVQTPAGDPQGGAA